MEWHNPYKSPLWGESITPYDSGAFFVAVMCVYHWHEVNHFFASYCRPWEKMWLASIFALFFFLFFSGGLVRDLTRWQQGMPSGKLTQQWKHALFSWAFWRFVGLREGNYALSSEFVTWFPWFMKSESAHQGLLNWPRILSCANESYRIIPRESHFPTPQKKTKTNNINS